MGFGGYEGSAEARGLRAEIGLGVMARLRRAAILGLDMRTEFEVLGPGEVGAGGPRTGSMSGLGVAIVRRVRRAVSRSLDLWTEFATLD